MIPGRSSIPVIHIKISVLSERAASVSPSNRVISQRFSLFFSSSFPGLHFQSFLYQFSCFSTHLKSHCIDERHVFLIEPCRQCLRNFFDKPHPLPDCPKNDEYICTSVLHSGPSALKSASLSGSSSSISLHSDVKLAPNNSMSNSPFHSPSTSFLVELLRSSFRSSLESSYIPRK